MLRNDAFIEHVERVSVESRESALKIFFGILFDFGEAIERSRRGSGGNLCIWHVREAALV